MFFYWDRWSREHATRHGVSEKEARSVVVRPTPPDPTPVGAGKLQVWGATEAGRLIQVIYLEISPERIRYDELDYLDILDLEQENGPYIYIVHARDLTPDEKRLLRRRRS